MRDIIVDSETHDLLIDNDLSLNNDIEYLKQKLNINLWFFFEEWYLDTSVGIPYYQNIMVKNPDISQIEAIFKKQIIDTDFVQEITSFDLKYDTQNRKLSVSFSVKSDFGPLDLEIRLL
jgi:hypothetical protein